MHLSDPTSRTPALSICIPTRNRASFIGATLDSILPQITTDCEIVVLDGGSTDATPEILLDYAQRTDQLRYIHQETNGGIDRDCDRIVEMSRGRYCWLMSDDDFLKPGAVSAVLSAIHQEHSLIIVNMERRDPSMSFVLEPRWLKFDSDRMYGPGETERLLVETDGILAYMCCCIVDRQIWLSRNREIYYGSLFIHVGVMFQRALPGSVLVISEPTVINRLFNAHEWSSAVPEIFLSKWPELIASLRLSPSAKRRIWNAQPWRDPYWLLTLRGWGIYSFGEYRRWLRPHLISLRERITPAIVATLPGVVVNTLFILKYSVSSNCRLKLELMKRSRFYPYNHAKLKHKRPI